MFDPFPSRLANLDVVRADEAGELVAEQLAVEDDDGNARVHRLRDRLGERCGFLRADNDEVHAGADEFLDVRALLKCVVLCVLENYFDLCVFVGGGFDIRVHLHAPRFAQIALAHADRVSGFGLFRRVPVRLLVTAGFAATPDEERRGEGGENGDPSERQFGFPHS